VASPTFAIALLRFTSAAPAAVPRWKTVLASRGSLAAGCFLLMLVLVVSGAARAEQPTRYQSKECSYSNGAKNIFIDGSCVRESTEINGHFAWIITFKGGVKVTVEYVSHSGADHSWKINGQPAWGYEITRRQLHGATLDLKQSISWEE
jgi:hypothetical protein